MYVGVRIRCVLFRMLLVIYMFVVLAMEVTWALGAWSVVYHGQRSWTGLEPLDIGIIVSVRFDKVDLMDRG